MSYDYPKGELGMHYEYTDYELLSGRFFDMGTGTL
jgi:hypothetical protein